MRRKPEPICRIWLKKPFTICALRYGEKYDIINNYVTRRRVSHAA